VSKFRRHSGTLGQPSGLPSDCSVTPHDGNGWVEADPKSKCSLGAVSVVVALDIDRFFNEGPPNNRVPRSTLSIKLHGSSDATAACGRSLLTVSLRPEATVREMQMLIERTPGLDHR
jgi:hypothetical protein